MISLSWTPHEFACPPSDSPADAVTDIWRASPEWGDVYSMVMTDSCGTAAECHDRMPVLLAERDWGAWLAGSAAEVKALCVPYEALVALKRTGEWWGKSL